MPGLGYVVAGGAVVLRKTSRGREVLLVHRPKYDDWSFPKGKRDPGEHVTTAAVREVLEESGVEIRLGRPLLPQIYPVSGGREKKVHYWVGRVVGDDDVSGFVPNNEIDGVRWVPADEAPEILSYPEDVAQLDEALIHPKPTSTLIVLRHARALGRDSWKDHDPARPLAKAGERQAGALAPLLRAYGVAMLVSSPSTRCVQTVTPYSVEQVIGIDQEPRLSEEDFAPAGLAALCRDLLASPIPTAICTHRPVLPEVWHQLGIGEEPLDPAELVVIHHRNGKIRATERHLPL